MTTLPRIASAPTPATTSTPAEAANHLLSIGQIAKQLGVQPRSIYRWLSRGAFPSALYRLPGGRLRWSAEQVAKFLREHEAEIDGR